ncbi:hypothetical protein IAE19_03095 [Acinetobacter sp. S40]|uniref:hypothetical protein n=1 Tax=Acinetobacter sp. S40 TaxID=2767434 RepID=UPI0019092A9A|nr:hypothetical protein [Acinetobacter sp. S40]MBJ9984427.1 hypothetical protein [Acinetobacter sp. S40]
MENNLIALGMIVLVVILYMACSIFITSDQLQNFTLAFIFVLSFGLLFRRKIKKSNQQQLGQEIGDVVRSVIYKEQRQGGLLVNSQKHTCAYSIIHQVGGIQKAKSIMAKIPKHIFSMKVVEMTHYDPIFYSYWYVSKYKKTNKDEYFACHLGELQTFPNPNPPKLVSLKSIADAIKEIEKDEQPKI